MVDLRQKLIRRLKYLRSFIRAKEREGFTFNIDEDFSFDKTLKSKKDIQRELKRAQKWSADELYKHATYKGKYSDYEETPATQYRTLRREWTEEYKDWTPDASLLDWLYDKINELPSIRYFKGGVVMEISLYKDMFISELNDTLMGIESKESETAVKDYFRQNEGILTDAFTVISYASQQEDVSSALHKAYEVIARRAMTPQEAEKYSIYGEYYDSQNEEALTEKIASRADFIRSIDWTRLR